MIERVAAAIYAKYEDRPEYAQGQMNGILAEELARTAIEAMREPTEAVGREAFNHVATDDWLDFLRGYRAMIDAALEEGK